MNRTSVLLMISLLIAIVSAEWQWIPRKSLPSRRSDHTCEILDGEIYVMGGCSSDQVYDDEYSACHSLSDRADKYIIADDEWVELAPLPFARNRHVSVMVGKHIYLFGGAIYNSNDTEVVCDEVHRYSIEDDKWAVLSVTFEHATTDLTAFAIGNLVYLVGGYTLPDYTSSKATHVFDIGKVAFTYHIAELKEDRGDASAGFVNGSPIIFGGYRGSDICTPIDTVETFNPKTNQWTSKTSTDVNAAGDKASLQWENHLYALGGEAKDDVCKSLALDIVEFYNNESADFEVLSNITLSGPRFRFCAISNGTNLFVIGGQDELQDKGGRAYHNILSVVEVWVDTGASGILTQSWSVVLFAALFSVLMALRY